MKRVLYLFILLSALLNAYAAGGKSYHFQRAEEAYQQKNYDECIRISELGVQENPKDGYCWALLAELYSKRAYGEYAKALEAADMALKYIPKNDAKWKAFLICIKGDVYYKIEDYRASKEAYGTAMSLDKENQQFIIDYADVCYVLGEYEEGIQTYERMLEKFGGPSYAYAELAKGYYRLGRFRDAKKACKMAIVLTDDENYGAHHLLARMAIDEGLLPQACREEARALTLENEAYGEVTDTLVYLCRPLMDAAMLNELQKVQTDASAHIHVANYYFTLADFVKTSYHLQMAEKYGTERNELRQVYAALYQQTGELDKAIETVKEWMAHDSLSHEHQDYYFSYLASLHREKGEAAKSFRYSHLELSKSPDDGNIYRMMGRSQIMLGDLEKALAYMDSAVLISDEEHMPTCLFNRAEVHRRMGNEEAAKRDLDEAMSYRNNLNQDRTTFLFVEAMQGKRESLDHYADSVLNLHRFVNVYQSYLDLIGCYALLHDKAKVVDMVDRYFAAGYRNVASIQNYYRLDWLREDADFQALMAKWESVRQDDLRRIEEMAKGESGVEGITELPFTMEGGVCQVKCAINGLPLYFVFDTGAADVTISSVEANFMLKNGYLTDADFLGKQNYVTATGEIHEGTVINLREVRVGSVVLNDVKASVVKSQHAPLLLGQSVFRRFGTLEVDNKASIIRFRK